jgi:gamma-glutamyltranspeptidase/glutathione hydrolase
MPRRTLLGLLATIAAIAAPTAVGAAPYQHTVVPTATGSGGAASTVDGVATTAAIDVLKHGGNAVDAAVAAAGVLGVVEPYSCGIGGGGFMVIRTPRGKVTTLDGRETAPAALRPDSFFIDGRPPDPASTTDFSLNRWSGLSAGVPGTPATWAYALKRYGTWSLARALAPGIDVARQGFVIDDTFFDQTDGDVPWFDDIPSTAAIYLDADGTPHDVGTVQTNPDMARTYARMAALGVKKGFYRGPVAKAMAAAAQDPPIAATADHTWRPGLMTTRDVRRYRVIERAPTQVDYRNYRVYSMAPPSSGGSTVGEALNILEQLPAYAAGSVIDKLHYYLEASRYAFADRNMWVADPAFFDVPLTGLLSDSFAAERAALIGPQAANATVAAGDPTDNQHGHGHGYGRGHGKPRGPGASVSRTQSTTHLTVVDKHGMVVTYTFTIESIGGNGIVVPGWGFLLNNELTDFNTESTTAANRADGGKRPRSSMAPTYVEQSGRPFLALGSPGGSTIITTVLQMLVERLDLGMALPAAITDPRASQRNGPTSQPEQAFLTKYGALAGPPHNQAFGTPTNEIGSVEAVEFLPSGGFLAAAEPTRRGGGNAQVVSP